VLSNRINTALTTEMFVLSNGINTVPITLVRSYSKRWAPDVNNRTTQTFFLELNIIRPHLTQGRGAASFQNQIEGPREETAVMMTTNLNKITIKYIFKYKDNTKDFEFWIELSTMSISPRNSRFGDIFPISNFTGDFTRNVLTIRNVLTFNHLFLFT